MKKLKVFSGGVLRNFYYFAIVLFASAGGAVFAEDKGPIQSKKNVIDFFNNTASFVQQIFWAVAIIAVFYAGFLYATAGGDEQKVEKAKKSLLYAVIAIAIGIMAFGIEPLVRSILGGTGGGAVGDDAGVGGRR